MYTVWRVKRGKEKASRTLFITKVEKRDIFLLCTMEISILSLYLKRREKCLSIREPSINYSSAQGSGVCGRDGAAALGLPESPSG